MVGSVSNNSGSLNPLASLAGKTAGAAVTAAAGPLAGAVAAQGANMLVGAVTGGGGGGAQGQEMAGCEQHPNGCAAA